jgi:DNA-binding response OmpR family regulator
MEQRPSVYGGKPEQISSSPTFTCRTRTGFEVIMELRAFNLATPIIVMSDGGRTKQHLFKEAELLGVVRTVAKPFSLDLMLATVKHELARLRR